MQTLTLGRFIAANATKIVSEWEEFARTGVPAAGGMDLQQRRDHVGDMLKVIARDLETPQTKREQADKSKGKDDADVGTETPANAHGTDRAATGFSPVELISEFRALRASVLRLWSEAQSQFSRENVEEISRFNEAIDQLLVESMTRYAKDVDWSKDLFLGVLGHDLRNPLGAIMMSATLMLTEEAPDRPHLKTASRILSAATRMEGLIGDLVDFTRTRLGRGIPIVRAPMDLEATCRQTVDELVAFHPGCEVRFQATGELHGTWDSGRIAQMTSNLLGNAFQHGAEGVPIDVEVRGGPEDVVLSVHNLGRQIPKEHLRDIFDPFTRLEPGSTKPKDGNSIGLGLYIVRAIAEAHRGRVEVESTERGTTFTVRLARDKPSKRS